MQQNRTPTRSSYYFDFLCDIVWENTPDADESYEILLLRQLHETPFYPLVLNDENRASDGLDIRDAYFDGERGGLQAPLRGECTMLEMLIGLSYRLESLTAQSRWEKTPREWFWVLVDNLGLDYRSNRGLSRAEYCARIVSVCHLFLERQYESDGNGGLFPLKTPGNDQKRVEIWYQMSAFIIENYPI